MDGSSVGLITQRSIRLLNFGCALCPHYCQVDRQRGDVGRCRAINGLTVATSTPHSGEERCLSGWAGSGMVYTTWCNLSCSFCQNFDLNLLGKGAPMTAQAVASAMLDLQRKGCHNINWVTPTHQMPFLLEALELAREQGLTLPLVYNCGGYELLEALAVLDGVVDVYLPDFKFWDAEKGFRYTKARNYPDAARAAIVEMHRQVGDLVVDERGLAVRGLIVRHLVMPEGVEDAKSILRWIHDTIDPQTSVSLLHNYEPCYRAVNDPVIGRRLHPEEYREVRDFAERLGFSRVWPPISSPALLSEALGGTTP